MGMNDVKSLIHEPFPGFFQDFGMLQMEDVPIQRIVGLDHLGVLSELLLFVRLYLVRNGNKHSNIKPLLNLGFI